MKKILLVILLFILFDLYLGIGYIINISDDNILLGYKYNMNFYLVDFYKTNINSFVFNNKGIIILENDSFPKSYLIYRFLNKKIEISKKINNKLIKIKGVLFETIKAYKGKVYYYEKAVINDNFYDIPYYLKIVFFYMDKKGNVINYVKLKNILRLNDNCFYYNKKFTNGNIFKFTSPKFYKKYMKKNKKNEIKKN